MVHGGSPMLLAGADRKRARKEKEEADAGSADSPEDDRISIKELQRFWESNERVTVLDVRTERSLEGSRTQARGAIRMVPEHVGAQAREMGLREDDWLVAYCT